MIFDSPLQKAIIQKRYKRFLADITLEDGSEITAHVPNTGSMTNCWEEGWEVLISKSDNPKRKLPYTLEMTHNGSSYIGVNTNKANKIVHDGLLKGLIPPLNSYTDIKPEKTYNKSRIDFYLSGSAEDPDCFVEVKNVTLNDGKKAIFPDAITTRGQKHLEELMQIKNDGFRSVILFLIAREDVDSFSPATHIDPKYSELLSKASSSGVELLAYQCKLTPDYIKIKRQVPICL